MIEDIGIVTKIEGDIAFIEVERTSACAKCTFREVEELAGGKPVFEAINTAGAGIGDKVRITTTLKTSAIVYGIPVMLLIIGAIMGVYLSGKMDKSPDTMAGILGMAGLIIGILMLLLFRKKGTKKEYMPVVAEIIRENL
ncbi:MAG: SoxR reducing system RseC family protein [Thermodesulfovibrionales bacterium]|nr:SoxR reducing system RseC family protein [Nitrospinota bacterium]MCG2709895.1 SoxR reducing system RseC family protein [Thermodesulfovibrionales bacterium]